MNPNMHIKRIIIDSERFPTADHYPFNLPVLQNTPVLALSSALVFFVGENGSGKSTLLRAICEQCGIHIWEDTERRRFQFKPFEHQLARTIQIEWANGPVPGSYFGSQLFQNFAQYLDEWAIGDPKMLNYLSGKSLLTQSQGQSLMCYFLSHYQRKGIYFLDEPETALSPKNQLQHRNLLERMAHAGHVQFLIATHSPILLSCSKAEIFSFDVTPIQTVQYEQTDHYQIYHEFFMNKIGRSPKSTN